MDKPTFNIFGDIVQNDGDRWLDSDVIPAMVVGWLAKQGDADVEININSLGGDVTAGLAIANALKAYKGHTTANVLGVAASMSSVIACACDEIKLGKGAFLMIHNPWTVSMGNADELRKDAETLDKMRDSILGFYQTKCSADADAIKALMDAESWLDADALSAAGFAFSEYGEDFKAAACATRAAFDKAPEAARAFFAHRDRPAKPDAQNSADAQAALGKSADGQSADGQAALGQNWEARYKGASKKLNELQTQHAAAIADIEAKHQAAIAELRAAYDAQIKDFTSQLDTLHGDLDKAKADLSSAVARAETAEKELASKGEQLDRLNKAHALLTAGVLSPGNDIDAEAEYQKSLSAAGSAEKREALRKAHAKAKKTNK